jgi:hypothetical protein
VTTNPTTEGTTAMPHPTTTYHIGIPVVRRWATGTPRGFGVRYVDITEEATILGSMRAVDLAIETVGERSYCDEQSPTIEPNAGELGWPIGLPDECAS